MKPYRDGENFIPVRTGVRLSKQKTSDSRHISRNPNCGAHGGNGTRRRAAVAVAGGGGARPNRRRRWRAAAAGGGKRRRRAAGAAAVTAPGKARRWKRRRSRAARGRNRRRLLGRKAGRAACGNSSAKMRLQWTCTREAARKTKNIQAKKEEVEKE